MRKARTVPKERDTAVDLVKAGGILCVLLLHAASGGYWAPLGSFDWFSTVFWGTISRAAVPLFLMCSGALFLNPDKELPWRKLYGTYILRIFVAMVFWAVVYKLMEIARNGDWSAAALLEGGRQLLRLEDETHLYYLRIVLLFYAFLPIGRLVVRHASDREVTYLLGLWAVVGILAPTVAINFPNAPLPIPPQWPLNTTYTALGYGLLGYWLRRRPVSCALAGVTAAAGWALVCGLTVWASLRQGSLYNGFLEGRTLGVCLMAAGLFAMACSARPSAAVRQWTTVLSRASFSIYLSHMVFLHLFYDLGWNVRILPCLLAIPLTAAAALTGSFALWLVLRRLPWARRFLV